MNDTWASPHPSRLQLGNCTAVADWASLYWRTNDTGLYYTVRLVRNGLTSYFQESNVSDPGDSELARLLMYWEAREPESILRKFDEFAYDECMDEVCPQLGWQGLPDLAGQGMLANYYIQAILITLYVFVLLLLQKPKAKEWLSKRPRIWQCCIAIKHSARPFLDASIIFALAMLGAAAYTLVVRTADPRAPLTVYRLFLVTYLSHYTLIPALMLHHCTTHTLRRRSGRMILWISAGILEILTFSLWMNIYWKPGAYERSRIKSIYDYEDPDQQLPWDAWCTYESSMRLFSWLTMALMCFTLLPMLIPPFLVWFVQRGKQQVFGERAHRLVVIACLLAMWGFLMFFTVFRGQMNSRAGASNKDSEWSFGQILGLACWVPVIVELGYILREGPEKALSGLLVEPYEVKEKPDDVQMMETGREDEHRLLSQRQTSAPCTASVVSAPFLLDTTPRRNTTAT